MEATYLFFHGYTGIISGPLTEPGQGVEDGRFTAIGIACDGDVSGGGGCRSGAHE
jgi:hypothetical protein